MFVGLFNSVKPAILEKFAAQIDSQTTKPDPILVALAHLVAIALDLVIIAIIGTWLWNNSVAPLFKFANRAESPWTVLFLVLFIQFIR